MESFYPGVFVDTAGNYWDVPFPMAIDLTSVTTNDSSGGFHLSVHYTNPSCSKAFKIKEEGHIEIRDVEETTKVLQQGLLISCSISQELVPLHLL
ncbi:TRIGALACTOSYLDIACYLGLYCEROL 4 [Spatholobus suberectus]|nr:TRIGALACTOSYLDIACYLGLYCEROL 4 [Spatholobus suberectus]